MNLNKHSLSGWPSMGPNKFSLSTSCSKNNPKHSVSECSSGWLSMSLANILAYEDKFNECEKQMIDAIKKLQVEHDTTVKNVTELQNTQSKTTALLAACMVNMHHLSKGLQVYVENAEKKGEALDIEIESLKRDAEQKAQLMDLRIKYMEKKLELLNSKIGGGGSSSCDGLVEEMEMRGFTVDLVTISTLMISLYKYSRWDWTDKLMKRIRDGNMLPSVLKWKVDMEATLKAPQKNKKDHTPLFPSNGDFSDVLSLISSVASTMDGGLETDDAGVKDDKNSSTPIDQWSSSPHMDRLANQITSTDQSSQQFSLSRGQRVQAKGDDTFDIDRVNTFLSLFLAKGKLSMACKLFEIFSDTGANPVSYTYNSILSSFVKKGYFNEAWGVLSEMGEKVCPTDIATYNMIIQGLGKMGRADLASSVLDKLMKQGGYLDVVMYNTLINALGKANRIDEVNKLFKQMKSSGINPDVVTFNTLIEVHSKAGRLKDAYKFLKMMLDSGCIPNHVTDTTLDFLGKEIEKSRYRKASFVRNKDDS